MRTATFPAPPEMSQGSRELWLCQDCWLGPCLSNDVEALRAKCRRAEPVSLGMPSDHEEIMELWLLAIRTWRESQEEEDD